MYRCRNVHKIYFSKCSVIIEYKHSLLEARNNKIKIYPTSQIKYIIANPTRWNIRTQQIKGAFVWDDPDEDQLSEITWIMIDQMSRWIHPSQGFISSFNLPWSELMILNHWSWSISSQRNAPKMTKTIMSSWWPAIHISNS